MRVKIPGMDAEVTEFRVEVEDLEKRIRVFQGPQILQNDNLTLKTKLNSYFRLSRAILKRKDLVKFLRVADIWYNYLMGVASSEDDETA